MIFAVDFDGTCVEHMYPNVGPTVPWAAEVLRDLADAGHDLILWTMRYGVFLEDAVCWFAQHDLPLLGVNQNPRQDWSTSPKAYAHRYIDDAAVGCPLIPGEIGGRPMVDWVAVRRMLIDQGALP